MKLWHKTKEGMEQTKKFAEEARKRTLDVDFLKNHGTTKTNFPYNIKFDSKLKKKVKEQWGNKCVVTGITNEEHKQLYGRGLHIHHWNYDKSTDDDYWMLPVDLTINHMSEFDKEGWMSLFGGIAETGIPYWKNG